MHSHIYTQAMEPVKKADSVWRGCKLVSDVKKKKKEL